MKTISMNCPNCNAPLNVKPRETFVKCTYCDSVVTTKKDNPSSQYSNEEYRSRIEAEIERQKELEKITNEMWEYNEKFRKVNANRFIPAVPLKAIDSTQFGCLMVTIPFVYFFMVFCAYSEGNIGLGTLLLVLSVILVPIEKIMQKHKNKCTKAAEEQKKIIAKTKEEWEKIRNQTAEKISSDISELNKRRVELNNNADIDWLPEKYRNLSALTALYEILSVNTSYTMQQAINQYEMDLQREELNKMQIDFQKKMEKQLQEVKKQQLNAATNQVVQQSSSSEKEYIPSRCPSCRSVSGWKKAGESGGFSAGKAAVGVLFLGVPGLLAGAIGNDKYSNYECRDCGYSKSYKQ